MATSPLACLGPKRGRNCYVSAAFSGIPNTKGGQKIRDGYLTRALSGAKKRAELLCDPYILRGPQRQTRGENQEWLPHLCLLEGEKKDGVTMYPVHSHRSPTPSTATTSEKATPPLPSRGPKGRRKCYIIREFSGIPNTKCGEIIRIDYLSPSFSKA